MLLMVILRPFLSLCPFPSGMVRIESSAIVPAVATTASSTSKSKNYTVHTRGRKGLLETCSKWKPTLSSPGCATRLKEARLCRPPLTAPTNLRLKVRLRFTKTIAAMAVYDVYLRSYSLPPKEEVFQTNYCGRTLFILGSATPCHKVWVIQEPDLVATCLSGDSRLLTVCRLVCFQLYVPHWFTPYTH